MALTDNFTDASSTATVHAAHHNDVAAAVNHYAGGTTGQVPTKASSADHDIVWATPASGGAGGGGSFVSSAKWGSD